MLQKLINLYDELNVYFSPRRSSMCYGLLCLWEIWTAVSRDLLVSGINISQLGWET